MHSISNVPPLAFCAKENKIHQRRHQSSLKIRFQILCLPFKIFPNVLVRDFVVQAQPEFTEHLLCTPHAKAAARHINLHYFIEGPPPQGSGEELRPTEKTVLDHIAVGGKENLNPYLLKSDFFS